MVKTWKIEDAREDFDAVLRASETDGPQIISERGKAVAALLPIEQWRRMGEESDNPPKYRNLKEWILAPEPKVDNFVAPRMRPTKLRPPPTFED